MLCTSWRPSKASLAALLGAALVVSAGAPPACAQTLGPDFVDNYTITDLGTPPGVPTRLGGLTLVAGTTETLLIGGAANTPSGALYEIGVARGEGGHIASFTGIATQVASGSHISGFTGTATQVATAYDIDGGLQYGPGGILFATGYPNNTLLQYKPGSAVPDKVINLTPLGMDGSVGALAFVPPGFAGSGKFKLVSYSGSEGWYDTALAPDGAGTFSVTPTLVTNLQGGPEGIAYVKAGTPGITVDSILLDEWRANKVAIYAIDGNGDPIASTRREFMSDLLGAEGALIDPLTGDFIFSTFGSVNTVLVVSGFAVPPAADPPAVPEPGALVLLSGAALPLAGIWIRRRRG